MEAVHATSDAAPSARRHVLFGPFELRGRVLRRRGRRVRLPPKETAVLIALVDAGGEPVSREQLARAGWGDAGTTDAGLARCIHALRRALATADGTAVIETIYGYGFRLAVPIERARPERPEPPGVATAPHDPRAVELHLQAREFQGRRSLANLKAALAAQRGAVRLAPGFVDGWTALARLHVICCLRGLGVNPRAHGEAAREAAGRALALHPETAVGRAIAAWVDVVVDGDPVAAARLDGAETAACDRWESRFCRAWALASLGEIERALAALEADGARDDLRLEAPFAHGYLLFCAGRVDAALDALRRRTTALPAADSGWAARAAVASWCGHHDEAIEAAYRACEIAEGLPAIGAVLAEVLARAGDRQRAAAVFEAVVGHDDAHLAPTLEAAVRLALGDDAGARRAHARAAAQACPFRGVARLDPRLARLFAGERPRAARPGSPKDRGRRPAPTRRHQTEGERG